MGKYLVEMKDGTKFHVEADTAPTEEEVMAHLEAEGNKTPLLVTAGNAFSKTALNTLGLPAEAANLARNVGEYVTGTPWNQTTKTRDSGLQAFGFDAMDNAFSEKGLGLYHDKGTGSDFAHRMANRVGGVAGGLASGGGGSLKTLLNVGGGGLLGSTLGGEVLDQKVLKGTPYEGYGELGGGLLGGLVGGWRAIEPPAIGPQVTDAELAARVKAGKGKVSAMNTEVGNELDSKTFVPATEKAKASAQKAQGILNQLQLKTAARAEDPKAAAKLMAPVAENTKPGLMDRVKYATGTADKETAYRTAVYDAIKDVEKNIPGAKSWTSKLIKSLGAHAYVNAHKGPFGVMLNVYDMYKTAKEIAGWTGKNLTNEHKLAMDRLESIIRSGAPIPTKGTAVKNALSAGKNGLLETFGVDNAPGGVRGSGPIAIKPSQIGVDAQVKSASGELIDVAQHMGPDSAEAVGAWYLNSHGSYEKAIDFLDDAWERTHDQHFLTALRGLHRLKDAGATPGMKVIK